MNKSKVLITSKKNNASSEIQAKLTNIEFDKNSGCLVADCKLENNSTVLVWKIDGVWQGWTND